MVRSAAARIAADNTLQANIDAIKAALFAQDTTETVVLLEDAAEHTVVTVESTPDAA